MRGPTSLDLAVPFTVPNLLGPVLFWSSCLGSVVDLLWPPSFFGLCGLPLDFPLCGLLLLPPPLKSLLGTRSSLSTCMSPGSNGTDHVDLVCSVGDLRVTISGPPSQATLLLQRILDLDSASRASAPDSSPSPSTVVRDFGSQPQQGSETRSEIEATFSPCPERFLQQATRLSGSSTSGEDRVKRAWTAGQWAGAVLAGRILSPNRSTRIDLRPRCYVVLQASGLETPTLCRSAGSYWSIVGDFEQTTSVSHGFPSEQEAKIYIAGAGVVEFDTRQ